MTTGCVVSWFYNKDTMGMNVHETGKRVSVGQLCNGLMYSFKEGNTPVDVAKGND